MAQLATLDVLREARRQATSRIPYSVTSTTGERVQRTMTPAYGSTLHRLRDRFPMKQVQTLLSPVPQLLTTEQAHAALRTILVRWSDTNQAFALKLLVPEFANALRKGYEGAIIEWARRLRLDAADLLSVTEADAPEIESDVLLASIEEVAENEVRRTYQNLTGRISDDVLEAVAEGIVNGETLDEIMFEVQQLVDEDILADWQIERIVRTESNRLMSQGAFRANAAAGATHKRWITVGDDRVSQDICAPNEGDGRIRIFRTFGSGHMVCPGHPNCRCHIEFDGADKNALRKAGRRALEDLQFPEDSASFEPVRRGDE